MPIFTPDTNVKLLSNVPINGYKEQLTFISAAEQANYFLGFLRHNLTQFSYQRKGRYIAVPGNAEQYRDINYCMYQNNNYSGKWFYAFIRAVRYVSAETTHLELEMDSYQSWMFNIRWKPSYIVRCHQQEFLPSGLPAQHTVPEGLDFGSDYRAVYHAASGALSGNAFLIATSIRLDADPGTAESPKIPASHGQMFDRSPSMLTYYVVDGDTSPLPAILERFENRPWILQGIQYIQWIPGAALVEANYDIVEVWMSSDATIDPDQPVPISLTIKRLKNNTIISTVTASLQDWMSHFPAYECGKLYFWPYSFIEMTLSSGASVIIKPELLTTGNINYKVLFYLGANSRIVAFPNIYNNDIANLQHSIVLSDFPRYPVQINEYLLQMANNANSIEVNREILQTNLERQRTQSRLNMTANQIGAAGSVLGAAGGIASAFLTGGLTVGGAIQGVGSAVQSIANLERQSYAEETAQISAEQRIREFNAKIQDAEVTPPGSIGLTGGQSFNVKYGYNDLQFIWKTIRPEYAQILTDYFKKYGYASHRVAVPNLISRTRFNYIQCVDPFIYGDIPQEDLNVIKAMFSGGVTLWHDKTDIGNIDNNTEAST